MAFCQLETNSTASFVFTTELKVSQAEAQLLVSVQERAADIHVAVSLGLPCHWRDGKLGHGQPLGIRRELPLDEQGSIVAGILGDAVLSYYGGVAQMEYHGSVRGDDIVPVV